METTYQTEVYDGVRIKPAYKLEKDVGRQVGDGEGKTFHWVRREGGVSY